MFNSDLPITLLPALSSFCVFITCAIYFSFVPSQHLSTYINIVTFQKGGDICPQPLRPLLHVPHRSTPSIAPQPIVESLHGCLYLPHFRGFQEQWPPLSHRTIRTVSKSEFCSLSYFSLLISWITLCQNR